jgi:hypothetical protein
MHFERPMLQEVFFPKLSQFLQESSVLDVTACNI